MWLSLHERARSLPLFSSLLSLPLLSIYPSIRPSRQQVSQQHTFAIREVKRNGGKGRGSEGGWGSMQHGGSVSEVPGSRGLEWGRRREGEERVWCEGLGGSSLKAQNICNCKKPPTPSPDTHTRTADTVVYFIHMLRDINVCACAPARIKFEATQEGGGASVRNTAAECKQPGERSRLWCFLCHFWSGRAT